MKGKKEFLEYKQKVFAIPNGFLNAGNNEVSFEFSLPLGIPSSFSFADKHKREKPKAEIKYSVQAKLCTHSDHESMKYKQLLVIREPPVAFKQGERQEETS